VFVWLVSDPLHPYQLVHVVNAPCLKHQTADELQANYRCVTLRVIACVPLCVLCRQGVCAGAPYCELGVSGGAVRWAAGTAVQHITVVGLQGQQPDTWV
jgi:hypothetical protein